MHSHSMRNYNQILHGDQTRCEADFLHGRPRIRMLTCDLFAVSDFFVIGRVINFEMGVAVV